MHESALLWAAQSTNDKFQLTYLSESESPYFFEIAFEADDTLQKRTLRYRKTRCDYFDGTVLSGAPFSSVAPLDELAGYLWFKEVTADRVLLALNHPSGPEPNLRTSLCHARGTYDDAPTSGGKCETLELLQTDFTLEPNTGAVTFGLQQSVHKFPPRCD